MRGDAFQWQAPDVKWYNVCEDWSLKIGAGGRSLRHTRASVATQSQCTGDLQVRKTIVELERKGCRRGKSGLHRATVVGNAHRPRCNGGARESATENIPPVSGKGEKAR